MKKALLLFTLLAYSTISNAHVTAEPHTHDTFLGQWGWIAIPAVVLIIATWSHFSKSAKTKKS